MVVWPARGDATGTGADTCPTSYECGWQDYDYSGNHLTDVDQIKDYSTVNWDSWTGKPNDSVSSVASRFTRCMVTYYKDAYGGGISFTLSYPAKGGQYQDPYLKNGVGSATGSWDNQISSHYSTGCA